MRVRLPDSNRAVRRESKHRTVRSQPGRARLGFEIRTTSGDGARTSCPPEREARTAAERRHDGLSVLRTLADRGVRAPPSLPVLTPLPHPSNKFALPLV